MRSRGEWRRWWRTHDATSPGVWLVTFKKASGRPYVPVGDVVDEALAHGWIDSRPRKLDDQRSARLITPRQPTSNWSRVNKQRVQRLIRDDLITPAGLAAVGARQGQRDVVGPGRHRGSHRARRPARGAQRRRGGTRILERLSALDQARHPRMDRGGQEA